MDINANIEQALLKVYLEALQQTYPDRVTGWGPWESIYFELNNVSHYSGGPFYPNLVLV